MEVIKFQLPNKTRLYLKGPITFIDAGKRLLASNKDTPYTNTPFKNHITTNNEDSPISPS